LADKVEEELQSGEELQVTLADKVEEEPQVTLADKEEEEASDDEDGLEVTEVKIDGVSYWATDTTHGDIYTTDSDGEIGDHVGNFSEGRAIFFKKNNNVD
jgi:hypothetical protein